MNIPSIQDAGDLKGKRVLVRVDWSVPLEDGKVVNDFQIKKTFPTIEYLRQAGARIVLASHAEHDEDSLQPIFEYVKTFLPLTFIEESDMYMLENVRRNPGEKANSEDFAKELAELADIYVNEAFAVSHREHASIVGVPKLLPGCIGLGFEDEIKNLSKAFHPPHPFLFILGGAKFETKMPLVKKFQNLADEIFIAGANAKPAQDMGLDKEPNITLPLGDVAALDADEANLDLLRQKVAAAAFVVWNGPLGKYEDGYTAGTEGLAKILAESGKETILGGGDTLTVLTKFNLFDKFTFVSTGGGAMLDFLADETLPGLEVLRKD